MKRKIHFKLKFNRACNKEIFKSITLKINLIIKILNIDSFNLSIYININILKII